jgi:hypothetical protein
LERENTQQSWINSCPVIRTLKFTVLNQDVKTVSDLDVTQLYHATRRNSHLQADTAENQRVVGAVLLHRSDVGNFSEFDELSGNITVDIEVGFDLFHPQADVPNALVRTDPLIFKVCFIYENYSVQGRRGEAEFWFLKNKQDGF